MCLKHLLILALVLVASFPQNQCSKVLLHEDFEVGWVVNKETVVFELTVATKGFIGFGISTNGGMEGADIIVAGVYPDGTPYLEDRHGVGKMEPPLDNKQDYKLITASENATHTYVKFSRLMNTCDEEHDLPITGDTLKFIWTYGPTDNLMYHGTTRGSHAVNMLDPQSDSPNLSNYKVWRVSQKMTLRNEDTTYWCMFHKGPKLTKKHHVVGFNIYLDGPLALRHTHHADLYKCTAPPGSDANEYFGKFVGGEGYDCYFHKEFFPIDNCQLFEFQWSIGGKVTMFPEYVGVPIGDEPDVYYMTEIHFDNPQKLAGTKFTSGMELYYTDNLRQYDAGFLQIGVMVKKSYSLTVPPNSREFIVSSHCPGECTSLLPQQGVNAFVYLLHSHLSGRKMTVRQFRDGMEQPWLAHDHNFDFNYQSNRLLKNEIKIMPADHLTLECNYDSTWKNGLVTIGGRSPREEMCQAFIMYYPRVDTINQCGSYFKQQDMLEYMGIKNATLEQGEIDPTVWEPATMYGKKYTEVVETMVHWSPERRKQFQHMIRFLPQETYCYPAYENGTDFMSSYPEIRQEYYPPSQCASSSSTLVSSLALLSTLTLSRVFLYS